MTGRTHDLAAFTAVSAVLFSNPSLPSYSLGTVLVSFTAIMVGGLFPDIDQPTAALWHRIPAGSIFGHLLAPLLGGHRYISHSIFGIVLFGFLLQVTLNAASSVVLVDMNIVWWSFMIGYLSHLIMDTFTHEGVPWLFPIPWKIGIPPIKALRMHTGGVIEKYIVFPGLLAINLYLYYSQYHKVLDFVKLHIK